MIMSDQINDAHALKNPCFYCSRERRRLLWEAAEDLESRNIGLGHHKDDAVETLLIRYDLQPGDQHDDANTAALQRRLQDHSSHVSDSGTDDRNLCV